MTTTLASYLTVTRNLARYQQTVAREPMVKSASDYYKANIGKVKSVSDFVSNFRLLSYALKAYGLSEHVGDTALVTKVLEGGTTNPKALANTLSDPRWKAFARAFDFAGRGVASVSSSDAIDSAQARYVENELEIRQGDENVGVQLALYFRRVAPTIANAYSILADKNLLQVAQTIFRLPAMSASTNIDQQAKTIAKLMPIADLTHEAKVEKLAQRFTAMYDATYGPGSGASGGLTAVGYGKQQTTAAAGILQDIVSSNGQMLSKVLADSRPKSIFSDQLMTQLQKLSLGGI